jgi:hypothetical protein
MTTPRHDDDLDHDAWLRKALRHAPDADVSAPPALRERILREARASLPRVREPRRLGWGQRLWVWLAQPAVGAGLASVMLATVIGLMWQGQPVPSPTREQAALPETVTQAPAAAPAAAASVEPERAAPAVAAASTPAPALLAKARRHEAPRAATTAGRAEEAPKVMAQSAPRVTPPAAPVSPAPIAAAPALQTPPPPPSAAADEIGSARSDAANAKEPAGLPMARLSSRSAAPERRAGFAAPSLDALWSAIAREPRRWAWQRDGETSAHAVDAPFLAWAASVRRAADTHWVAADATPPTGTRVLLLRDGQLAHTLVLGDTQLHARAAGDAHALQAPLGDAPLRELREALQKIGP